MHLSTSLGKRGKLHIFLLLLFYWKEPTQMTRSGFQSGWEMWSTTGVPPDRLELEVGLWYREKKGEKMALAVAAMQMCRRVAM